MTRIAIVMPVLGFEQASGTLAGWLKRIGDPVQRGDAIAEVETEKVTVELEAIDAGTLVEILAEAGSEVAVGDPIGWLDDGA
jgi:pyruvate dehydrogenase E2 component (dihydrolipoamide acetyltransferase)